MLVRTVSLYLYNLYALKRTVSLFSYNLYALERTVSLYSYDLYVLERTGYNHSHHKEAHLSLPQLSDILSQDEIRYVYWNELSDILSQHEIRSVSMNEPSEAQSSNWPSPADPCSLSLPSLHNMTHSAQLFFTRIFCLFVLFALLCFFFVLFVFALCKASLGTQKSAI